MLEIVQSLYYGLPAPVRNLAASLYGYRLKSERYSDGTEDLVAQALEREQWSAVRWQSWREERLAEMLHRASRKVPYYREQWRIRRLKGDRSPEDILENWPILEKAAVRENAESFLDEELNRHSLLEEFTSGSTGSPLRLWFTRQSQREWYALSEARWRNWYGVTQDHRWAILGGRMVAKFTQTKPPFWVWNAPMRQLYMSSYHLSPRFLPWYLDELRTRGIDYLYGYSSSLAALAHAAVERGVKHPMIVAISNAEPLYEHQRAVIRDAFVCPVRETYGLSEKLAAASECEHGSLHLWPEAGFLEVDENRNLIGTGLLNTAMPLIRYRTGDLARFHTSTTPCACGRNLPRIHSIEGRADDILITADGRQVGRLDPLFKGDLPIREAQIVQESLTSVTLRLVPGPGYLPMHGERLAGLIRERMGDLVVHIERVARLERGPNGKLRGVVNRLGKGTVSSADA
ncbi:MAG: hypothetical protein K2X35_13525 [Bryobacteraceae bacterium]|nr:hypothetical protein [Bryobacteraceae bacterium]